MINIRKLSKRLSRKGLYEFLNLQFSNISKNELVLTIGAGGEVNNLLDSYALKIGFKVVSFDIDKSKKPNMLGDICSFNFENLKFNTVIICEVLEHVHAPQEAIDNIFSVLKKGGKLVLTTPFILPIHDSPYDYYRFTKFGLQHLLRNFKNVKISERNSYFETIDVLWVRILQTGNKRGILLSIFLIPFIYYIKNPFSKLIGKFISLDAMTTGYIVTATKNDDI